MPEIITNSTFITPGFLYQGLCVVVSEAMNWGYRRDYRAEQIALLAGVVAVVALGLTGCSKSSAQTNLIVRGVDEVQVMSDAAFTSAEVFT